MAEVSRVDRAVVHVVVERFQLPAGKHLCGTIDAISIDGVWVEYRGFIVDGVVAISLKLIACRLVVIVENFNVAARSNFFVFTDLEGTVARIEIRGILEQLRPFERNGGVVAMTCVVDAFKRRDGAN